MAELAALNVLINGDSSGLKAAITSSVGLVDKFKKSAEDSAKVFERSFKRTETSVDRLRRSLDPLYAASKRYESAVELLDKALREGAISQAAYNRSLDLAKQKHLEAADGMGAAAVAMRRTGVSGRMLTQQLSQVGQQFSATGQLGQAVAVQAADIGMAFGTLGTIIGTGIGLALPTLISLLGNTEDAEEALENATNDLNEAYGNFNDAAEIAASDLDALKQKYGENAKAVRALYRELVAVEQIHALSTLRETTEQQAEGLDSLRNSLQQFSDARLALAQARQAESEGLLVSVDDMLRLEEAVKRTQQTLRDEFNLTTAGAYRIKDALDALGSAGSADEAAEAARRLSEAISQTYAGAVRIPPEMAALARQAAEVYAKFSEMKTKSDEVTGSINFSIQALRELLGMDAGDDWLDGMISSAQTLADTIWGAVNAMAVLNNSQNLDAAGNPHGFGSGSRALRPPKKAPTGIGGVDWGVPPSTGGGGGGGGGSKTNPIQAELEALQQALMTAEELELQSWEKRQETLRMALEQRLLTQQEYAALMEDAQRQHNEKMAGIDAYRYGDTLQKTGRFLGDMSKAFAQGNDKMMKIGKAFGAAEALINAWRAYTQTLADPSLPYMAKIAAAANVLAAGFGAVNAIKGIGGGGSGGGSGGSASTAAAGSAPGQAGAYYNVTLAGDGGISRSSVRGLIEMINDEIRNGAVVKGIRVS